MRAMFQKEARFGHPCNESAVLALDQYMMCQSATLWEGTTARILSPGHIGLHIRNGKSIKYLFFRGRRQRGAARDKDLATVVPARTTMLLASNV
jgi:hypothetical protein